MENTSMKSLWKTYSAGSSFAPLFGNISTEVAVIGGGITGITTAQLLSEAGFDVAVLEAYSVGGGSTGGSTGNIYNATETGFDTLTSKYDTEVVRQVTAAREEALQLIRQNILQYSIDCDYKAQPWFLFSSNEQNQDKIDKEYKAASDAGVDVSYIAPGEVPFPMVNGIRIDNQGQFNPLRYVQQLAKAIDGGSVAIHEDTRVLSIEEIDGIIRVETNRGIVSAKYVVHATHTPKGRMVDFHATLGTYREYGVAVKLASGNYPEGIFWGYFNANDRFSVRSYEHDGEKFLVCVGQPHRVGQQENNEENIVNLENFLREHFDVAEVTNRWGGQNYKPANSLPYIGRKSKGSNEFVATGFSTDGLTWGTAAAFIIRDIIMDKETHYTQLFDATRHSPVKAAGEFIKENASNAAQYFKDYILFKDSKLDEIPAGEGKVLEYDGKKVAVYKNDMGEMKACSAICTHLWCVVHWNRAEKTWDCPCHASRFDTNGNIIEGPALDPLEQVTIREDN